jgi:ATP-dependent DNA ligase
MVEGPTLEERLQRLTALAAGRMQVAATVDPMHLGGTWTHVNQLLAETQADGHEGLILKRRGSLYQPSREVSVLTEDWLKLKVPVAASA